MFRHELRLLGIGKLGQCGEGLPVLEGGVRTKVGGSVRGGVPRELPNTRMEVARHNARSMSNPSL